MGIVKFLKRQMAYLSLAFASVEKNALNQSGKQLDSNNVTQEQRHTQGIVADDLKHGKITQEVIDLRWRTYKVLQASDGFSSEIVGYDENDMPIVRTKKNNRKNGVGKIKQDPFDDYKLEMVVDNTEIASSGNEAMANNGLVISDKPIINQTIAPKDDESDPNIYDWSATHGVISGVEYFATNKAEKPIIITRDKLANFEIENFTNKMHVRKINNSERLLEFYVSKYPDEYNRTSRLFISEIKKVIENKKESAMLDFVSVNFISYKTIGSSDFLEYEYNFKNFDKIVEHNGHYIIKFVCEVTTNGKYIMETHRVDELDKKYENKEKKK